MKEIAQAEPLMIGVALEKPFELGFGTLETLPRVLYVVSAMEDKRTISGIGEASIDFPFSSYDAWDIYYALSNLNLAGRALDRDALLRDKDIKEEVLRAAPAAYTAFNMAIDDLAGKLSGKSVLDMYPQKRKGGKAIASISYKEDIAILIAECEGQFRKGFIPKPKVGRGIEEDAQTIQAVAQFSQDKDIPFVLDFNATYEPEEFEALLKKLKKKGCNLSNLLFLEQPTTEACGVSGLISAKNTAQGLGFGITIMADESFVNMAQAIACAQNGIALNFKIHKVGGIYESLEIEKALLKDRIALRNMVGGTFPTAIGRTYDQQAAAILNTTSLPGDGWEPSTDWFKNEKHLIDQQFPVDEISQTFLPIKGPGLGTTINWHNVNMHRIDDPQGEYRKVRAGEKGTALKITIKNGDSYRKKYKERSGKDINWNL